MSEFINTADVIGDDEMCDQIIMRTVTEYKENRITKVGQYAFYGCNQLETVDLPNVTSIGAGAFQACHAIADLKLPKVTALLDRDCVACTVKNAVKLDSLTTFYGHVLYELHCPKLIMPSVKNIPEYGFYNTDIPHFDFYVATSIGNYAFQSVTIDTIIIRTPSVCTISGINWSYKKNPYIYVPRALIEDYKVATNWSVYADQFRALEDYTVDGTTTGELDETKI